MRMISAFVTAWLVSLPGAAAPASGWALQSMPTPGIPDASTSAVSCPSADACTAVGSYFDASGCKVAQLSGQPGGGGGDRRVGHGEAAACGIDGGAEAVEEFLLEGRGVPGEAADGRDQVQPFVPGVGAFPDR